MVMFRNDDARDALFTLALATAAAGCMGDVSQVGPEGADRKEQEVERSPDDAPSIFSNDLVYKLSDLPESGEAANIPWAGNYWPTYQDSINHRWAGNGEKSASEKYGAAFNVSGVEDAVSRATGIDSQRDSKTCTSDSQCNDDLGEACAKRRGASSGRCVATWFGICHSWAPIAVMYAEPKHEVVRNGVTFKVQDIKALLTLAHDKGLRTKFASGRCNENDGAGDIEYDENGRPLPGQCIDTNPASYHILLANYLGLRRESFVEDRTYDFEVWNQPLRGYRVTKLAEIDAQTANRLVGVKPAADGQVPSTYQFNARAARFYEVETEVDYISESDASRDGNLASEIDRYTNTDRYSYVLELDADGRLLGGEWTGESKTAHVDFVWLPTSVDDHSIAGGKIKFSDVMSIYNESVR
jgi:hypothetical protein